MLHLLDNLLRDLFIAGIDEIKDAGQTGFQPPDGEWRTHLSKLGSVNALNIYLYELRENRGLRSNEKLRSITNGMVSEKPRPFRIECHYFITAWSPANATPQIEPVIDEHKLLYAATAALVNNMPLNPAKIYSKGANEFAAWPEAYRETNFPTEILPAENAKTYAEFWSGLGEGARWKPLLHLVVTLPVELTHEDAAHPVESSVIKMDFKTESA